MVEGMCVWQSMCNGAWWGLRVSVAACSRSGWMGVRVCWGRLYVSVSTALQHEQAVCCVCRGAKVGLG